MFEQKIKHGYEGMIFLGLLGIIFAITFDLNNISVAGSLGFLIVFMLVNLANFRLARETKAQRWIAVTGAALCAAAIVVLVGYNLLYAPESLVSSTLLIVVTGLLSYIYSRFNKQLSRFMDKRLQREEEGRWRM